MPRNRSKPTNLEALDQVDAAVARVISTVRSVLRKYPYGTLHPTLVPYVHRYPDRSTRRSTHGDEIVLGFSAHFSKADMLSFPVVLLDAPEQEITRWARDQYWSAIEGSKFKARQEARRKTQATSEALAKAQRDHEAALNELATVTAPGKKKRQP